MEAWRRWIRCSRGMGVFSRHVFPLLSRSIVGRMCLALLRKCDRWFRRFVYGLDKGDCLTIFYTVMAFVCYHGSVRRNKDMWGYIEISVVIDGRVRYLCFAYSRVFTVSLV